MNKRQKLLQLSALLLMLSIIFLTISGRGCSIRQANSNKTSSGSSVPAWAGINAPSNLTATVSSPTQINLSWQDNSNNEDGFEIERSTNGLNYSLLSTLNAGMLTYSDISVTPSNTYYYRVRAFNAIGDRSDFSNTAIIDITPRWIMVSAGYVHTIALASDGKVWSWGYNDYGQLGLGDYIDRNTPSFIASDFYGGVFDDVAQISGGGSDGGNSVGHNIARKTDRTLWSWGYNQYGQLGVGDTFDTDAPIQIGTDSDWSGMNAGGAYTLGLKTNCTLWSWGRNQVGQLGLGDTIERYTPTQVMTGTDWSMVAGGFENSCAIKTTSTLWAWGSNWFGQLGLGNTIDKWTPTAIGTSSDWKRVDTGGYHTFGLKTTGTLWSCGYNEYGQLGLGDEIDRKTLSQIGTDSDWAGMNAGFLHTLGIKTNGTLWAWGYDQLGRGYPNGEPILRVTVPRRVGNQTDWSIISVGSYYNLALKTTGSLWTWGANWFGQLGLGDTIERNVPWIIDAPIAPSSLTAILDSLSRIDLYWVDNANNETGFKIERKIGSQGTWIEITTVETDITSWSDISATGFISNILYYYRVKAYKNWGESLWSNEIWTILPGDWSTVDSSNDNHSIGIKTNGTLWAWGYNVAGQLGLGDSGNGIVGPDTHRETPTQVGTNSDWLNIGTGYRYTLAIKTNSTLWAWGRNNTGQLGLGDVTKRLTPSLVGTDSDWIKVNAGGQHTLGIKTNGTLWVWGNNQYGQLGLDTTDDKWTPTAIGTSSDWLSISAGSIHNLGIKTNGALWAWGMNNYGQLGLGDTITRLTPSAIGTSSDWMKVNADGQHTLGIKTNKTLWAWGWNYRGQLGLGDEIDRKTPSQIGTDSDWISVNAGSEHTSGIKTNGTLWVWGSNLFGRLGLGNTMDMSINIPTPITIGTDWIDSSAGSDNTLSLLNGTLWVWGSNDYGQLGLGDTINRNVPTLVEE